MGLEAAPFVDIAGALAGGAGSAALGSIGPGAPAFDVNNLFQTPNFIGTVNNELTYGLNQAINSSTNYTNQAIGQQNTSLNAASNALQTSLTQANQAAQQYIPQYLQMGQAAQQPLVNAGYNALDAYQTSLGLQTPQVGSATIAQALKGQAAAGNIFSSLANPNSLVAPTAPGTAQASVTPSQVSQFLQSEFPGANNNIPGMPYGLSSLDYSNPNASINAESGGWNYGGQGMTGTTGWQPTPGSNLVQDAYGYLANQQAPGIAAANSASQAQYAQQMAQYQSQLAPYQTAQNFITQSGYTPQMANIAAAYSQGLFK